MTGLVLPMLAACAPHIGDLRLNDHLVDTANPVPGTSAPGADRVPSPPAAGSDSGGADTGAVGPAWTTWQPTVDATDHETWVHLDLDDLAITDADGPWTVRLQRYRVALNGGVSGDAGLEATWADGRDTPVTAVPDTGWTTDAPDADEDGDPEYALGDWYAYDEATHVLTPRDRRWWVRTAGGGTASVVFLGYYDRAGTSGHLALDIARIDDVDTGEAP